MQNLVISNDDSMLDLPPIHPRNESGQVQVISNGTITQEGDHFSACLLVMDDIHFLKEWLAYHYHALPLRRLIVAVDPNSKTSPSYVFDRWRKYGMVIDEWSDDHFIEESDVKKIHKQRGQASFSWSTKMHRWRQRAFYAKCLKTLKNENQTWTMLTDTDEYLTLNTYTQEQRMDIETPGLIMKFLNEAKHDTSINLQPSPCIMMPRLTYGSKESTHQQISSGVPQPFNGSDFVTQRFRKHGPTDTVQGLAKTIIDLSRVKTKFLSKRQAASPHRPIIHYCPLTLLKMKILDSPLVVRHYLGTWEQFSYRDDARKRDGMKSNRVSWLTPFVPAE